MGAYPRGATSKIHVRTFLFEGLSISMVFREPLRHTGCLPEGG